MDKFFKKCCIFTSCRKKEPLLDNDYGPKITEGNSDLHAKEREIQKLRENVNSLQKMVDQAETIMHDQNIQLQQQQNIHEKITKCTLFSFCKHKDCDFNPMLSAIKSVRQELKESKDSYDNLLGDYNTNTSKNADRIKQLTHVINCYKKDLESKENTIDELSNSVQVKENVIHNLQKNNTWYEQNKKALEAYIEYCKNDVTFLANSQQFYKNETEKLKQLLSSTRLEPILEEEYTL